ncbi:MAG TPA: hypothetical protein ENH85_14555 [Candidatus Scalindua sp.]|nr:hypothetical protein [Candidatus Scalindua sp.]
MQRRGREREGYDKMENIEQLLSQDYILLRVHQFELQREEGRMFITVKEVLVGSIKGRFFAIPNFVIQECSNPEYIGLGDSVEEALKDCLKRIKEVPLHQIIPENKVK